MSHDSGSWYATGLQVGGGGGGGGGGVGGVGMCGRRGRRGAWQCVDWKGERLV